MNDVIDNDTGEALELVPIEVSGAVAAEISQQVATARRYPRRPDRAIMTEITGRATLDEETAAECVYTLPRAGKDIVGPSIRFAEIVFASYGNLRANARFVEIDTKDPTRAAVVIEGMCIDVQMNNAQGVPVRRSIVGKRGIYNADMTNIAFSAGAAIARREAILKTVPKSVWGGAWKQVIAVLQGDVKTLATRRHSAIEAFNKMGVAPDKVFAQLGVQTEDGITLEHMPRLIGMWTALRDGSETIESIFGRGATGHQHQTVDNPLQDEPNPGPAGEKQAAAETETGKSGSKPLETQGSTSEPGQNQAQANPGQDKRVDPISSGPQNTGGQAATGASNEADGAKTAAETKPAQAAAASSLTRFYEDAEGYVEYMRDSFDRATSKTAIKEVWSGTRDDRRELLGADQLAELEKDKKAAEARLDTANG